MRNVSTIAVVPARGGSKGIPRKNVRILHGKPLIAYSIEAAKKCGAIDKVIVSTDDEEIAQAARMSGAQVVMRPNHLAEDQVPLDPVIHHAISSVEEENGTNYDVVITLQPTSPLLCSETIERALERFLSGDADTVISVVDDRHLSWTRMDGKYTPLYEKRVNRQLQPPNFRETGGFVITWRRHVTDESRFGPEMDLFEVPKEESIDIDTPMDWWLAEKLLGKRRILFRVDGHEEIGLGHVYRTLMIASKLIDHDLLFATRSEHDLGKSIMDDNFYPVKTFDSSAGWEAILNEFDPHIVINDILDTDVEHVKALKDRGVFVVNFEDLGPGTTHCDLVINALYESPQRDNMYFGKDYYCLRDEFLLFEPREVSDEVKEVLITFGGTDPNDYTGRVMTILDGALAKGVKITIVTGPGYMNASMLKERAGQSGRDVEIVTETRTISEYMHRADIVFTSAGRTVYEVAALGTPMMVLAQNERETRHTFARESNGIVNLGLGYDLDDDAITEACLALVGDPEARRTNSRLMLSQNLKRGMENVLRLIFNAYDDYRKVKYK